jgi:hypothetical protein
VRLEAEKMSKSLGNMIFVRTALETTTREALRLYLLDSHYRRPFDHDEAKLIRATERAAALAEALGRGPIGPVGRDAVTREVLAALDDDLGYAHRDPRPRARRTEVERRREAVTSIHRAPCARRRVNQVELLAEILAREGAEALGWERGRAGGSIARTLLRPAARRIAQEFAACDEVFATRALPDAARWTLEHFSATLDVAGLDRVPRRGPILLVANHPGLTDAVGLIAALDRPDVRIVAADYPFLHAMRGLGPRLIFLGASSTSQLGWIRAVARRPASRRGRSSSSPRASSSPIQRCSGRDGAMLPWSDSVTLIARLCARCADRPGGGHRSAVSARLRSHVDPDQTHAARSSARRDAPSDDRPTFPPRASTHRVRTRRSSPVLTVSARHSQFGCAYLIPELSPSTRHPTIAGT